MMNSKRLQTTLFPIILLILSTCQQTHQQVPKILPNFVFDYEFDLDQPLENVTRRSMTMRPMGYGSQNGYQTSKTSPYQVIPGSYSSPDDRYYTGSTPYNQMSIYSNYLSNGAYQYYSPQCQSYYSKIPKIGQYEMNQAFSYANYEIMAKFPEYSNQSMYKDVDRKEIEGHYLEMATEYFAKYKCLSKYQLGTYLPTIPIGPNQYFSSFIDKSCLSSSYNDQQDKQKCYPYATSKYRTFDGSCNNLRFPHWGRSFTCHIRMLPPDYSDGIQSIRMSKYGRPLPNARTISNYVTLSKPDLKAYYSSLILSWGQFINHDMSETGAHLEDDQHKIDCCKPSSNQYKCCSIPMTDPNDYMNQHGTNCFNLVRSSPCSLCKLGPREQTNTVTSFLDASHVYGATVKVSTELRTFQKGQLLSFSDRYNGSILPPSPPGFSTCQPAKPGLKCFKSGDNRVNQNPILMVMHTLIMRNHNYHAYKLSLVNPRWNDERLYQEARRLVIAEIQHITMNEYLPVILGPLLMDFYRLNPKPSGYTQYESYTDPSTWNEFVTAASRYGHSQIKDYYQMIGYRNVNRTYFALKDNFFEPGFAWDGLIEDVVRGMVGDYSDPIDPYYSNTAKNFAVKRKTKPHGIDMVTTNIMRGRDHGLPGYVHYLKSCFNYEAKDWKDLEKFIPREILLKLKYIYSTIEDIDLYVGGVSERHFIDAGVGPTFGCLVGIQYYHLKYGDRYFYEHGGQSGSFTPTQLNSIRSATSMARLLCRTGRYLLQVQPKPFYLPSRYNQPIDCSKYPEINYLLWKEY